MPKVYLLVQIFIDLVVHNANVCVLAVACRKIAIDVSATFFRVFWTGHEIPSQQSGHFFQRITETCASTFRNMHHDETFRVLGLSLDGGESSVDIKAVVDGSGNHQPHREENANGFSALNFDISVHVAVGGDGVGGCMLGSMPPSHCATINNRLFILCSRSVLCRLPSSLSMKA